MVANNDTEVFTNVLAGLITKDSDNDHAEIELK